MCNFLTFIWILICLNFVYVIMLIISLVTNRWFLCVMFERQDLRVSRAITENLESIELKGVSTVGNMTVITLDVDNYRIVITGDGDVGVFDMTVDPNECVSILFYKKHKKIIIDHIFERYPQLKKLK